MAAFRRIHYGWAEEYINRWTDDPRGTGGTPYMQWLKQMLLETEAHRDLRASAPIVDCMGASDIIVIGHPSRQTISGISACWIHG